MSVSLCGAAGPTGLPRPTSTLVVTAKPGLASGMLRDVLDAYAGLLGAVHVESAVSGYREQAGPTGHSLAHRKLTALPRPGGPADTALPADDTG